MVMNPATIKPVNGHALVVIDEGALAQRMKASGLVMADQTRERDHAASMSGAVLAVADDIKFGIAAGQRIVFGRYSGTSIKDGDTEYRLVVDDDVKGVCDGD